MSRIYETSLSHAHKNSDTEHCRPKTVVSPTHTRATNTRQDAQKIAPNNGRRTERRQFAQKFINSNRAGALATVGSGGRPHVAIVFCVAYPDLSVYFSTRVEGRKFINLLLTSYVAMSFHDENNLRMMQLTGTAKRVEDLKMEQAILYELMKLRYHDPDRPIPPLQLFERGAASEIAVMKITPAEMTYANFRTPRTGHYTPVFQKII